MSFQATTAVLKHSEAEGSARMILFALASHAHSDGSKAHPGITLLCKETKLCERAVKYGLKSLLASGEILVEEVGGGRIPSSYRINLPIAKDDSRGASDDIEGCKSQQDSGVQMAQGCKSQQAGVQMATPRGANGDIAYKEQQSVEPSEETTKGNTNSHGSAQPVKKAKSKPEVLASDSKHPAVVAYRDFLGFNQINRTQAADIVTAVGTPFDAPIEPDWARLLRHLAGIGISWKNNVTRVLEIYALVQGGLSPDSAHEAYWQGKSGGGRGSPKRLTVAEQNAVNSAIALKSTLERMRNE